MAKNPCFICGGRYVLTFLFLLGIMLNEDTLTFEVTKSVELNARFFDSHDVRRIQVNDMIAE